MRNILVHWAITVVAVFVATQVVGGISFDNWVALALFALILGLVNAVVKPILTILALPVVILTLGIALLIINALTFWLASALVPGFQVMNFGSAFFGALIVSIVSALLGMFLPDSN